MSTAANSYYFRRRTMGRAASPPTWACYEQIHNDGDYSDSDSDSCSEDDDDYNDAGIHTRRHDSDSEDNEAAAAGKTSRDDDGHDIDMDMDVDGPDAAKNDAETDKQKDVKGKQRAVEPEPESPRRQRKKKQPHVYTLRPILTIHKSQGFVWNQVCFCLLSHIRAKLIFRPRNRTCLCRHISKIDVRILGFCSWIYLIDTPYLCLDIASTSPPNSRGFISSSVSSNNSAMTDYEVEVVEIRVKEGELDDIIP